MRAVLLMGVVIFAAGCMRTTSAVRPDDELNQKFAYGYGRFFIRSDNDPNLFGGRQSIGLQLSCANYALYTIWFSATRDVQAIKIIPSSCALVGAQMADDDGMVRRTVRVEPADLFTQEFVAGKAYYLGDYFARGVSESTQHISYRELYWSWAMAPADDRYEATTAEMKRTFRNLASLPTEDKRLIPRREGPKRGAVVVDDPKEPPMTPERVARIAPFLKRSFPSPAACEASCPTGQCLPFRGGTGAAMACIVRCNTNRDCPGGLACNCPNAEVADETTCRPIATTPADRLARICLAVEPPPEQP